MKRGYESPLNEFRPQSKRQKVNAEAVNPSVLNAEVVDPSVLNAVVAKPPILNAEIIDSSPLNNDTNYRSLLNAVVTGDVVKIEKLIQSGLRVDYRYGESSEDTLAHYAVYSGQTESFKKLLNLGLKIDTTNKEGVNAAQAALICGQKGIVEFLVQEKLDDPNLALHYIASMRSSETLPTYFANLREGEIIPILLNLGANIHHPLPKNGIQPIHRAVLKKNLSMVNILLDNGANILAKTTNGNTVLHLAAGEKWVEGITKFLEFKNIDVNSQNCYGHPALSYVIDKKSTYFNMSKLKKNIIEKLLQAGALWNIKAKDGNTPLDIALATMEIELLGKDNKLLIFKELIADGDLDMVKKLFVHSSFASIVKDFSTKLLHYAIESEQKNIFKYFEDRGADIHGNDENGSTLLHYAALFGKIEMLEYLINKGLDIFCINHKNTTALHFAASTNQQNMIDYLINKYNFNPALPGWGGETILHYAVSQGSNQLVEHLITTYNIDVNIPNQFFITPLHHAIYNKQHNVVELLIKYGADINSLDFNKDTPLDKALDANDSGAVKLLIKYGGNTKKAALDPSWSLEVKLQMRIYQTLKQITSFGKIQENIDTEVLQHIESSELKIYIKNSMGAYFSDTGIPNDYIFFCRSLNVPEKLYKIILSCYKDFTKELTTKLFELEGKLHAICHGISSISYETLSILPLATSATTEFYDQNEKYQIAGTFLMEVAGSNSKVIGLSMLDFLMINRKDVKTLVNELKTCALPVGLKYIISKAIIKFNSDIKDPEVIQLCKAYEKAEYQNNKPQEQENELLKQNRGEQKMKDEQANKEALLEFCQSRPGFKETLLNTDNADEITEYMYELLGGNEPSDTSNI